MTIEDRALPKALATLCDFAEALAALTPANPDRYKYRSVIQKAGG